jgi:hypothetical protein
MNPARSTLPWVAPLAALAAGALWSAGAAAETRGFVVNWFHMSTYSTDDDCPGGVNPPAEQLFVKIMKDAGKGQEEIDKALKDFPNPMYFMAPMRGRIDGKPANVYVNPTSEPDPMIKIAQGKLSYGFNLDGKDGPNDFKDPDTGETGIDNMLYRAVGCFNTQRGTPPSRPTFPAIQWDMLRDQMPAWLIEVKNIDDPKNDPDVDVTLYRATGPIMRNAAGEAQADQSFQADGNPRNTSKAKGHIKDGVLYTDTFDFNIIGDPFSVPEYHFHKAKLKLAMAADGVKGVIGGYHPWRMLYASFAIGGSVNEANLSIDVPGIYYAMRKLADGDPDPATGENRDISATYAIEGVPAFVIPPKDTTVQTSERR